MQLTQKQIAEKEHRYNLNRSAYDYYKSRGICPRCKKEKAKEGHVLCQDCLDERASYSSEYYAQGRQKQDKEQKKRYMKRRKALCVAFGVCVTCMKRDAQNGITECSECATRRRNRYRDKVAKTKSKPPKDVWATMGLCTMCGEPVKEGYKLCEKHLETIRKNGKKGLEKMHANLDNHIWRKIKDVEVTRIQKSK